jgi:ADP-ribose pyrophosphatase
VTRSAERRPSQDDAPTIVRRTDDPLSDWVSLTARWVSGPGFAPDAPYHSFVQRDYVTVLATTADGDVALVEQFRPALERVTLELPGGLVDDGDPAASAVAELLEETGLRSDRSPELLAVLDPDSGRLENRLWCFRIADCGRTDGWSPEPQVRPLLLSPSAVWDAVSQGQLSHALHIAVLGVAVLRGTLCSPETAGAEPREGA